MTKLQISAMAQVRTHDGEPSQITSLLHTHIGIMPVIKDQITALRRHNA
jgi:hypothetical protein